ncbi:MAG: nucleoside diphosphate kinase regulator [Candidatus Omnitrophica bacterium]|nr:nucleoside diphosphate kinase regulator [Candidatus Omnitrophota bacterium]
MSERTLYITAVDKERLHELIISTRENAAESEVHLKDLEAELEKAIIVSSKDIPRDVITMDSQVCVKDLDTQEENVYTLVFPSHSDIERNRISVLSPIGVALLGYRAGDVIEWKVPAGIRKLKIKKILYQPEAIEKGGNNNAGKK